MTEVLVLGAGYAGLTAVLKLQKSVKDQDVHITLINKHNYHYQTTWLHRNAVGVYKDKQSMIPIESVIDPNRVTLKKETVEMLDVENQVVTTDTGEHSYDYLIIALGSEMDTKDIPGLSEHAQSIVTLAKANRLYNRLLTVLSDYKKTKQTQPLSIVIGGGGFTGVELLGELTEHLSQLCIEYGIDYEKVRLLAVESEATVLPEFDLELGEYAMQKLEGEGVEFKLNTRVKAVERHQIKVEHAGLVSTIPTDMFVWTAGVKGSHLIDKSILDSVNGRVEVNEDLTVPGYENVFVIGDVALVNNGHGNPYLPNADIAIQKGKYCAKNVSARIKGQPVNHAFRFKPYGSQIASLGPKDAIGVLGKGKKIVGWLASRFKRTTDHIILLQMGGMDLWWKFHVEYHD